MSLNLVLATATPSGLNLTASGGAQLATHTVTAARYVSAQIALAGCGGAVAATVEAWTVIRDASNNTVTPKGDYEVRTKATASTRMLFRGLGPVWLPTGWTIEAWAYASASATAASATVTILDLAAEQALTGATLTEAYDAAKTAAQAGDEMGLTEGAVTAAQAGIAKTSELPDLTDTEAALVKIQAAVYDSATADEETGEITLANGATQTVTETGRVTIE